MTNEQTKKDEIGSIWNLVADLGNGRQLSVSWNLPKGVTPESINTEVDKLRAVIDRQQAKSASRGAAEEIAQLELRLESATEDMDMINAKMDAKNGMTSAERQQREAAVVHLSKMKKDINFKKGVLDKILKEAK